MMIARLFILTILLANLSFAQTKEPQQPIIDMHLHAFPVAAFDKPAPPNPITGTSSSLTSNRQHMQATFAAMRRYNIVKAVVSVIGGSLDVAQQWRSTEPNLVIATLGGFDGSNPPDLAMLRREFLAGRLGAVGEIGAQYAGLAPDDPKLEPYFALAEELNIPVGLHTGLGPPGTPYDSCCPHFRVTLGNPKLLEEVLIRHPKLRIYIMHAGWPYLAETKALMYMYPQVYADLAAIDWLIPREEFHDYLQSLMRCGFGKRLMFGTDQGFWPEGIGMAVEGIESAPFLTSEQKRDIFYNNAVRFLKLDGKRSSNKGLQQAAPSNNLFNRSGDSVSFMVLPAM